MSCLGIVSFTVAADPDPAGLEFFEKRVRPILISRCYECHSSKNEEPKGGLRVDTLAALLKGGETGPGVVPGKTKDSLMIDAVNYGELYQMPPKGKMPADEIDVLTKWVEMGAPWPAEKDPSEGLVKGFDLARRKAEHWAWQPLKEQPLPTVKNEAWIRQPSDRFVLAKLEAAGLSPAPPADRRTLIRRVYFDLIGLPPTPAEVHAFLNDQSTGALEKVVDRLLQSPHFGERWGRHWLDLMRYAESRGHEFDYTIPGAHQYRDYVIRALNADVPYDQFMTEHIAGDLMRTPRQNPEKKFNESILGTGFWYLGEWIHSPVDIRKDETDRFDNMVDVFSKSFLGLTVSCARCHDHKFDAISQKDYYALFGYLQSSGHRLVRFETQLEEERVMREVDQLTTTYRARIAEQIAAERASAIAEVAAYLLAVREVVQTKTAAAEIAKAKSLSASRLEAWVKLISDAKSPADPLHLWWLVANDAKATDSLRLAEILAKFKEVGTSAPYEGEWIVEYGKFDSFWNRDSGTFALVRAGELLLDSGDVPSVNQYTSLRRDSAWNGLIPDGEQEAGRLGFPRAGRTIRSATFVVKDGPVHYLVKGAGQVYAAVDSHAMLNGPLHGALVKEIGGNSDTAPRWITHDLQSYVGHNCHLEFTPKGNDDLQILAIAQGKNAPPLPYPLNRAMRNVNSIPDMPTAGLETVAKSFQALFATAAKSPSADASPAVLNLLVAERTLWTETPRDEAVVSLLTEYREKRDKLIAQIPAKSQLALAMWDGNGVDEHLLIRGNSSLKTAGPLVPRRLLEAIEMDLQAPVPTSTAAITPTPVNMTGSGRLQLAQKLTDPRNPFPSRVMVNRIWHHLFGRGIVPSVDNFGVLGQEPTHPELLDHLALQFMADGWSVKHAIRRLVLSNAYQMASGGSSVNNMQLALADERDPENLLFHKAQLRRLEGEIIRDSILTLSGRLDKKQFGPSVPTHLTAFMQGRGRPGSGPLDGDGRRSIYLGVRRNFLSPLMLAFDVPNPASTIGKRNVSNVPAQALILMNDPLVSDQAKLWARRTLTVKDVTADVRIGQLYEEAFSRPATTDELTAASEFLKTQGKEYGLTEDKVASDERVWTDLCHVLINSKEFVFIR
ncbi:PSD1 and planctomycete cytochrome C domain-containing protein [Anatilimnocola sp. NA78]|uniref:PSD1 and planctomycete cytochrome C domain-containing protein n=1 Tax=Anatilimnocola sp. NA78 TaxID=3415683 RepID=UPI003CE56115